MDGGQVVNDHEERLRRLEIRETDTSVMPWQPLGYYLAPFWKGTKNIPGLRFGDDDTYNDLTASDYTPRFRLDRDEVQLGGCMEFDIDRLADANTYGAPGDTHAESGTSQYVMFIWLPATFAPAREQHLQLGEDLDLSETGWLGSELLAGTQGISDPRGFGTLLDMTFAGDTHTNPPGDPLLQGTVVCLDGISWQVSV
jgi:hypothetical protein